MNIFFDFETNGLPLFKERSDHPGQPHIVQLAMILAHDDGTERDVVTHIIRPDGWTISPEMTAIHGISHERAMDEGIAESVAVDLFILTQAKARIRVAHNESFDRRIARIAMTRSGVERDMIELIEARQSYCTCNAAKPIVNLPPTEKMLAAGFKGPKSPSLSECYRHFFGETLEGAHDALIDARGCARIYRTLVSTATAGAAA